MTTKVSSTPTQTPRSFLYSSPPNSSYVPESLLVVIITDWDEHLEKLTDFWESNLFFKKKYTGNPLTKHVEVDKQQKGTINEMHFGVWLNLWFQTIDNLFVGEVAQLAKNRARNMGTFIHLKIFEARTTKGK